jgi:hypothetical protein
MTPFVKIACEIWDNIITDSNLLWNIHGRSLSYESIPYSGVIPKDKGDFYEEERLLEHGVTIVSPILSSLKKNIQDLQLHLLPKTILGASNMSISLYYTGPKLRIGPWATYSFHINTPEISRSFIQKLSEIAEQDGTGSGAPYNLNLAKNKIICFANQPQNLRSLFELCQEDLHIYSHTGIIEKPTPLDIPLYNSICLPDTMWSDLWDALNKARAMGIKQGNVTFFPYGKSIQAEVLMITLTPSLRKKVGEPNTNSFKPTPEMNALLQNIKEATLSLYDNVRTHAPILKSLDKWSLNVPVKTRRFLYGADSFSWGPKAQSLSLMRDGPFASPNPVLNCNESRFKYTLEKALGALSSLPYTNPTYAWKNENTGEIIPGNTLNEALQLSVALAAGNKPSFVPGSHIKARDFPRGGWEKVTQFP